MHFDKRIINWPPFMNTVYSISSLLMGPSLDMSVALPKVVKSGLILAQTNAESE